MLGPLAEAMGEAHRKVKSAPAAAMSTPIDPCTVCTDETADQAVIIVVEDVADLWRWSAPRHERRLSRAGGTLFARSTASGRRI